MPFPSVVKTVKVPTRVELRGGGGREILSATLRFLA